MKYVFYESFMYGSNTALYKNRCIIVNRVTVYTHPQKSLIALMLKRHLPKYASYNPRSDKLYIRERVRKANVRYVNRERFGDPEFQSGYSINHILSVTANTGEES